MPDDLLTRFLPGGEIISRLFLPLLLFSIVVAVCTGQLKRKGIHTPYTRKTFHFLIFSMAGAVHYFFGLQAVTLLGIIVSSVVVIAMLAGKRWWFYRSLARETDAPHEKKFILLPLLATIAGGILSNILFPSTAYIGYFVGGWGDAVGEPVGTRWGRHRYSVPTLFGVPATRSLEGSLAVFLAATIVTLVILLFTAPLSFITCVLSAFTCGLATTLIEAISSHGLDNLTIQVCAAGVLHWLL